MRLRCRVDPTGMDAEVQAPRHLVVDGPAKPRQASERRLDVAAGTPTAVVEIEVAKGGIEVVKPHQANDAAAEPDAFGIAGRAVNGLGGFRELVGLVLVVLGDISRVLPRLGLILGILVAALGKGASDAEKKDEPGDCEMT